MADMEPEVKTTSGESTRKKSRRASFRNWLGSPSFYIYLNFFLSQWGDWMWQFAVGLYLVYLSEGQLLLAAIFGFSGGGCILLFGGIIGDWVDRNGRLKVVRVSLVLQNISVMCSAICVCVVLALEPTVTAFQDGHVGRILMEIAIIVLAISAQLSNVAYTIAIEKDWIVVIAQEKSSNLANLNAGTRSLALVCKILSPTSAGFIMTYGSLMTSAIVIAAWNLVSVFFEYAILSHIYRLVPRLAVKKNERSDQEKEMVTFFPESESKTQLETDAEKPKDLPETAVPLLKASDSSMKKLENKEKKAENGETKQPVETTSNNEATLLQRILKPFFVLVRGWHTYAQQTVVYAGVSLAFLYMTVLGFDSITLGYIYANHVSELLVGVCMALAGVTGIIGTILFTRLRKQLGLETTGLIAYSAEIVCLVLAVISIWAPGSRFDPYFVSRSSQPNCTIPDDSGKTNYTSAGNLTVDFATVGLDADQSTTVSSAKSCEGNETSHVSIILLLVGIITSRVGLWMADLVVTQLMQETVLEKERGVVHGVQNSLNMLMDMLKFVFVIVAPQIEIFGFHIIISFSFICMAGLFFVGHVVRVKRRQRHAEATETSTRINLNTE